MSFFLYKMVQPFELGLSLNHFLYHSCMVSTIVGIYPTPSKEYILKRKSQKLIFTKTKMLNIMLDTVILYFVHDRFEHKCWHLMCCNGSACRECSSVISWQVTNNNILTVISSTKQTRQV